MAVSYTHLDFNNLVTYTQKFKYLRQQLETTPHTHEEQMAGTQFMKVNLSNLRKMCIRDRLSDLYAEKLDQKDRVRRRILIELKQKECLLLKYYQVKVYLQR